LRTTVKYISRIYRVLDISPLDRNGSSLRTIIFITWAVNAVIFLTIDFLPFADFYVNRQEQTVSKYTIELFSADVHPDVQITFFSKELGIISSNDVNPFKFEINRVERVRGPPL
jgi:hypothetical protein